MPATDSAELTISDQIRAMRSAADFERLKAAGAFGDLDGDALAAVLDVFARENRKKPRRFWAAMVLSMVAWGLLLGLLQDVFHLRHLGGGSGVFGMVAMGIGAACAATPLQRRLAVLIADLDDVRVVGALTDALDRQDVSSRKAAVGALKRLLPGLAPEHSALLTTEQRKRLGTMLAGVDADLASATLRGLVRIGDTSCYDRAARLAEGKGLAKKHADLMLAAQAALPELEALREKERQAATLLRPADAPPDATLLRPADGAPHGDDATLLRPAEEPAREVEAHG